MKYRATHSRGFAATELVLGTVLLLLPSAVLVATLPTWLERRVVAQDAARDAARLAARAWPAPAGMGVAAVVARAVTDQGLPTGSLRAWTAGPDVRGGRVLVTVTVTMPRLVVPGLGRIGTWHWTTRASQRVDDFAGR